MSCHCNCHQAKTKRKSDYRATSTLIARSEWLRLTPEDKAEIERRDQAHAEWLEKWNSMTISEKISHSIQASNETWKSAGEAIAQIFKPSQTIEK